MKDVEGMLARWAWTFVCTRRKESAWEAEGCCYSGGTVFFGSQGKGKYEVLRTKDEKTDEKGNGGGIGWGFVFGREPRRTGTQTTRGGRGR